MDNLLLDMNYENYKRKILCMKYLDLPNLTEICQSSQKLRQKNMDICPVGWTTIMKEADITYLAVLACFSVYN